MPKVYVSAEDPRLDYTSALQFGSEIVGVFPPGQVHLHPQVALNRARGVLRGMNRDDFLVLSGDPVKIGICYVVAAEQVGRVRALRWNRQTSEYVEVAVDFLERAAPEAAMSKA